MMKNIQLWYTMGEDVNVQVTTARDPDRYLAFSYITSDQVAFGDLFPMFNRGSGVEHPALDQASIGLRSLSVGDVVVLYDFNREVGASAHRCERFGWVEVDINDFSKVIKY